MPTKKPVPPVPAPEPTRIGWEKRGPFDTPLEYFLSVMNDNNVEIPRRDMMAKAAAPFVHGKVADAPSGRKEERKVAAAKATEKFQVPPPPRPADKRVQ